MGQVQGRLNSGSKGRGKQEGNQSQKDDEVLKTLVEKLTDQDGQESVEQVGVAHPYLDEELDLPGLEVPDREE